MRKALIIFLLLFCMAGVAAAAEVQTLLCLHASVHGMGCRALGIEYEYARSKNDQDTMDKLFMESETIEWYLGQGWSIVNKEKVPGLLGFDYKITLRKD